MPATAVVHSSAGALAGRLAVHVTSEVQSEVAATGLFIEWGSPEYGARNGAPRSQHLCQSSPCGSHVDSDGCLYWRKTRISES